MSLLFQSYNVFDPIIVASVSVRGFFQCEKSLLTKTFEYGSVKHLYVIRQGNWNKRFYTFINEGTKAVPFSSGVNMPFKGIVHQKMKIM